MPTASNAPLGTASLLSTTSDAWVQAVLGDFDTFLLDHAACERKASAMAMTFVVRYPDRDAILDPMIQLAREELAHFHAVFKLLQARGLHFVTDQKDPYLNALLPHCRNDRKDRDRNDRKDRDRNDRKDRDRNDRDPEFLDRLLMAGVVEARGCERFGRLADALEDTEMKQFYAEIAASESRHAQLFVDLASQYFDEATIQERLRFWLERDAEIVADLPPRAALH
jgi:tRNA-(ms[2]io[6]A)-hydroxylase